jgi:transcription elongation factor SPT6
VSPEKLLIHLERALVTVVNSVGVDIQSALGDAYLQKMLPFLAGMGPRKVERLLKGIQRAVSGGCGRRTTQPMLILFPLVPQGGLNNRARLLIDGIAGPVIAQNLAPFIYLNPGADLEETDLTDGADTAQPEGPNPLDSTRIHPLDYDLAYQLCENLMGLDPEDAAQQNRSIAVLNLMSADDKALLLGSVDVETFAEDIRKSREGERKGYTIKTIMEELNNPYKDRRRPFVVPTQAEIFTMLTGETASTVSKGLIVTARITNTKREKAWGRLDSGLQVSIPVQFITDEGEGFASDHLSKGQTVRGAVINVDMEHFEVELAVNPANVSRARPVGKQDPDPYFDREQQQREELEATRKKRQDMASTARIIKHPLWQLFNKQQAEAYLADGNRGDAVIRPSSQGLDHLAITWKVDEGIYQHVGEYHGRSRATSTIVTNIVLSCITIDVLELEKANPYALGKLFRVGNASYMDLDEVMVNHIKAVASQVDKLTEHDKYIPEDQIGA